MATGRAANTDSQTTEPTPIVLANWGRRLIAWFIDYITLNIMLGYFRVEDTEAGIVPSFLLPRLPGIDVSLWSPLSVLSFFLYWTLSEWYFGRSLGQLLVNIRLVDLRGRDPTLIASAVQSLGKSLFLPFDCLAGWAYGSCRERRQRFFNKLSGTLVVYIGKSKTILGGKEYAKEP